MAGLVVLLHTFLPVAELSVTVTSSLPHALILR